jgi:hypothetical protein
VLSLQQLIAGGHDKSVLRRGNYEARAICFFVMLMMCSHGFLAQKASEPPKPGPDVAKLGYFVGEMAEIKSTLRKLRLIQFLLMGFVLICALFAELTAGRTGGRWTGAHWLVAGLAAVSMLEGFHFRHRFVKPSADALARDTRNLKALKRWEAWQLICLTMAGAVACYGLVVRIIFGGTFWQALLFYSVGLFLSVLWTPRRPAAIAVER